MSDPMATIRASFFLECEELLESLQDGLQAMYDGATDDETVNVVFRAVHSIKGGAGAFGLDTLVAFAHRFETALDEVRGGRLVPDAEAMKLFFRGSDILGDLVRDCRDGRDHDEAEFASVLAELDSLVGAVNGGVAEPEAEADIDFQPMTLALDLDLDGAPEAPVDLALPDLADGPGEETDGEPRFRVQFRPAPRLYANGSEPLYLFRALRDLGHLTVSCRDNDLPGIEALDPGHSHIGWDIEIATSETETAIREAFDFVEGLCELEIEPMTAGAAQTATAAIPDRPNELPARSDRGETPARPGTPDIAPADLTARSSLPDPEAKAAAPPPTPASAPEPPRAPAAAPAPKASTSAAAKSPVMPRSTVRVDLERIDRLVNLVGEIVINQAMLTQSVEAAGLPPNSAVRTGLEEFLQLTRDIQDSVMMIRAQPVKSLFQRMSRIVREASADIGKDVRLRTDGEHTEVDKTVIERLADPLTHMIRNAVDHGLESNDDRVAAGKPSEGNVYLAAMHRSGRVVIEVADDGAGINRDKVLRKAVERGLVPNDAQLSDSEIDNLLFLPGFSTADSVSNLSGRGVGMDVVRSAIQALGGRIAISSERGHGTTFSISLPLTLAVLDGMVVRVAGETLVVPLNAILETLALTDDDICAFDPNTHVVNIRNRFVPLLDLGAELGYRHPLDSYTGCVVLLIGREDGSSAAVVVDTIEDQRQVVIKGLQDSYGRVPGIAAATILGDGQIALILDPVDLVTQARGQTRNRRSTPAASDQPHSDLGKSA